MAVDKDFVVRFKQQIRVLKNLKEAAEDAIDRAEGRLKQIVEEGKSVEEVFGPVPPRQSPADQGGGG